MYMRNVAYAKITNSQQHFNARFELHKTKRTKHKVS